MTDKQSEALRLADALDYDPMPLGWYIDAAAELRRLHEARKACERQYQEKVKEVIRLMEINAELVEALEAIMDLGDTSLQLIYPSREAADKAKAALRKAQGDNNAAD